MYLQLADNNPAYLGQAAPDLLEYMVAIPTQEGGIAWVREDMLDNVPDAMLYQILQAQPHMAGIKDWFARMRERREDRRGRRIETREERRDIRSERMKGGGILERVIGSSVFGQPREPQFGTRTQLDPQSRGAEDFFPQITGSASIGVAQWWQNPAVLIGGAVVILGGIYLLSKRKR